MIIKDDTGTMAYANTCPKPTITYTYAVKILSRNNQIPNVIPKPMTVQEIEALDYLDPTITCQLVTLEGSLVRRGSYWYAYFVLIDGEYEIEIIATTYGNDV